MEKDGSRTYSACGAPQEHPSGQPPGKRRAHAAGRSQNVLSWLLMLSFFLVMALATMQLISISAESAKESAAFDAIDALVDQTPDVILTPLPSASPDGTAPVATPAASRYQSLYDRNGDFAAWISIEGTMIDYPVMLTPDDPEYYLHRAFDKSDSISGVPFIGAGCTLDSNNIIVYGHNMKDGTMFHGLLDYEDEAFYKLHRYISFDTLAEDGKYEILAVFKSEIYADDADGVFRYYEYGGELDESTFDDYVKLSLAASLYDTGVTAQYGDRLITLSTCAYHVKNGRFVVVAKRC